MIERDLRIRIGTDSVQIAERALAEDGPALVEIAADREDMAPTNMEAVLRMRGLPSMD